MVLHPLVVEMAEPLTIVHEKTGLICDGNSLENIYDSINNLLANKKYKEFGIAAKENSKNFLWSNIIEKYKRIL